MCDEIKTILGDTENRALSMKVPPYCSLCLRQILIFFSEFFPYLLLVNMQQTP